MWNDALLPLRMTRVVDGAIGAAPERGRSEPDRRGLGQTNPLKPEPKPDDVSVGVGGSDSKYPEDVRSAHWCKLILGDPGPRELARDCDRERKECGGTSMVGDPEAPAAAASDATLGDASLAIGDEGTE